MVGSVLFTGPFPLVRIRKTIDDVNIVINRGRLDWAPIGVNILNSFNILSNCDSGSEYKTVQIITFEGQVSLLCGQSKISETKTTRNNGFLNHRCPDDFTSPRRIQKSSLRLVCKFQQYVTHPISALAHNF